MSRSADSVILISASFRPLFFDLLRHEILLRDADLLVLGVTGETNDLHPVEERRRNVQRIGRRDEHHIERSYFDLDVVIDERIVLLRIEHLEQRGRRITAEVHAHLVDFVEQEQWILHPDLAHALQDLARHRTDVGPAMPANLGFVANAAETHPDELAIRRARDRLSERRLADARRPDQAQDRRLQLVDALLHRQVLDDPFLDLLEPVVVGIEHLDRAAEVLADLALLLPRQSDQRVDVVAHDGRSADIGDISFSFLNSASAFLRASRGMCADLISSRAPRDPRLPRRRPAPSGSP
jgi:hypothetical protein